MPGSKHGWNRLRNYAETHRTVLDQYVRDGFVHPSETLPIDLDPPPTMEGKLECVGKIVIEVNKGFELRSGPGGELDIRTVRYRYHVRVAGVGNVFRYCSAHDELDPGVVPEEGNHHPYHHKHTFDFFAGDARGKITLLLSEDEWPTLGEVIDEARAWYYDHLPALERVGIVPGE